MYCSSTASPPSRGVRFTVIQDRGESVSHTSGGMVHLLLGQRAAPTSHEGAPQPFTRIPGERIGVGRQILVA